MSTVKRTFSSSRKRIVAAFGMAALVALTGSAAALVDLEGEADGVVSVPGVLAGVGVDVGVEIDDLDLDDLDLDELDLLDDLDLELPDLDLPDGDLPGPGDGDGLDLDDLLDLELDELPAGELGPLVQAGRVFLENTTVSLGNNILRDADIRIGDSDTLSELLGLANLLPGPGNGGGDDDDEEEDGDEDDDSDLQGAGAAATVKPSAAAKAASGPDLVGAAVLEQPTSLAAPLVQVAGDAETAPARGPLPRTGGPAGLAGMAAALLGSSGAIRMMLRRRRGER